MFIIGLLIIMYTDDNMISKSYSMKKRIIYMLVYYAVVRNDVELYILLYMYICSRCVVKEGVYKIILIF